jgi:lysine N6-hydroxylase
MLVDRCTLQNPFVADLVSLADPTSPFSYLNYCKRQGRIYACYVRENFYLTRHEYNRYCQWAASQLESVRFHHEVTALTHDDRHGLYIVSGRDPRTGRGFEFAARRLVIGVGASPRLPACCDRDAAGLHSAGYLRRKEALQRCRSITVVGSGQSAAEIVCDLLQDNERRDYHLQWVTRSSRFFQLENTKLATEHLLPDYADHFFALPQHVKERVVHGQGAVYNGINPHLINALYDLIDERRDVPGGRVQLLPNMELLACVRDSDWRLEFRHTELDRRYRHRTDGLVMATGYAARVPPFVEGIRHRIAWDAEGRYRQRRHYAVDVEGREIFVQNAGCHAHGVTGPDLGLACHRNAHIVRALTGVEHYPIETRTALQDFRPRPDGPFVEMPA